MASSLGRMGLAGSTGTYRAARKGADRAPSSKGSIGHRAAPASRTKALRKEDFDLLKEAESYMSQEEHAELRRLLEENQKLRQVVTSSSGRMSPGQLEYFTRAYSDLAKQAEQAGVVVDAALQQAQKSNPVRLSQSSGGRMQEATATGGSGGGYGGYGGRSYSASVAVADPPASGTGHPSHPSASPARPPASFAVSSRDYAHDMASMSVELDSSSEEEDGVRAGNGRKQATSRKSRSGRTPSPRTHVAVHAGRFETLVPDHRTLAAVTTTTPSKPPATSQGGVSPTPTSHHQTPPPSSSQLQLQHQQSDDISDVAPKVQTPAEAAAAEAEAAAEAASRASLRAAAVREVETHSARDVVAGREHWMIITVPEQPVAGAPLRLYFNRNQSDKLRHRPHIVCQYGFNHWELAPESGNRLELAPAPEVPRSELSDFWCATLQVPEETYELNFILHDTNGAYENNNGMDFTFQMAAGISYDEWIDKAAERAVAKELARREAEAKAAAEEKARARELMTQQAAEYGKRTAEELIANLSKLQEGAVPVLFRGTTPVYRILPAAPTAGNAVTLQYNRKSGPFGKFPVPEGQSITLLYGFNGWQNSGRALMERVATPGGTGSEDEDWFQTQVSLPLEAVAMNFVLNYYEHYDNNSSADYKVKVALPSGVSEEAWSARVAEVLRGRELERRLGELAAAEEKQRRAEEKKKKAQDMVQAVERRKVRHVLFTSPEVVTAGQEVTVFYNPRDTPLAGRSQIYLMGGWNRWTHKRHFGPVAMHPPEEGAEHWQATVPVPKDAYKMDFVFADVAGGDGTYDNRGGFDYHLPVEGSPVREAPLYVCHIAVEMAPIAKVGGLGDVVTALGRAVKEQGHLVEVVLPRYEFFNHSPVLKDQMRYETEFDWGGTRIFVTTAVVENLRVFFIEPRNGFFATQTVYGRYDDEVRFDFFCKAALEFLLKTGRQPDILHCHDWSTAHVAQSYWADYHPYGLSKPRVVFTIHNLNYGQKKIGEAAHACQKFTTVSPTYAFEVGGHQVIGPHSHKFMGIRNGIDPDLWSPEDNQFLPVCYSSENVLDGKKAARQALRQRLGLTAWNDKFIVAVVSRLTGQKGVPLIKHAAYRAVDRGGQFVLLGSAPDPKVQADFNALAASMGGQDAAFCFKYDEPLSHLIYAAADMIVVPSMFEPCGLTQMIAMRYGSVPVVRHTGGLRDTVFDVDFDKERAAWELYGSSDWQRDGIDATNGFAFTGTDGGALDYALNRAIDAWYNDREWFRGLQKRVMDQDWSWNRPAIDYIELYFSALKS